jgi:hypothetical protein
MLYSDQNLRVDSLIHVICSWWMFALNVIIYFHDKMNFTFKKILSLKIMFQYIWIEV